MIEALAPAKKLVDTQADNVDVNSAAAASKGIVAKMGDAANSAGKAVGGVVKKLLPPDQSDAVQTKTGNQPYQYNSQYKQPYSTQPQPMKPFQPK